MIKDRIKEVRKANKLSQTDFGKSLGVSRDIIANLETGRVEPTELIKKSISNEFGISLEWLETGEGDMFLPMTEDEELAKMFGELFAPDTDPRIKKAVKATIEMLKRLPEDAIPIIGDYAEQIADALKKEQE